HRDAVGRRRGAVRGREAEIADPDEPVQRERNAPPRPREATAEIGRPGEILAPWIELQHARSGAGISEWRFRDVVVAHPEETVLVDGGSTRALQEVVRVLFAGETAGELQEQRPGVRLLRERRRIDLLLEG